jgi:hypothetical protein
MKLKKLYEEPIFAVAKFSFESMLNLTASQVGEDSGGIGGNDNEFGNSDIDWE